MRDGFYCFLLISGSWLNSYIKTISCWNCDHVTSFDQIKNLKHNTSKNCSKQLWLCHNGQRAYKINFTLMCKKLDNVECIWDNIIDRRFFLFNSCLTAAWELRDATLGTDRLKTNYLLPEWYKSSTRMWRSCSRRCHEEAAVSCVCVKISRFYVIVA